MKQFGICFVFIFLFFTAFTPTTSVAAEGNDTFASPLDEYKGWGEGLAEAPRRSFEEFVKYAEENGTQLQESMAQVEFSKAREDFASAKSYPAFKAEIVGGPIPGAEGDALRSETQWDNWNVFGKGKIEMTQPLYTFGAISSAQKAARAATTADEKLFEKEKWKLRTEVAELYFGYQLAFELEELASDLESKLQKAQKSMAKRGKRGSDYQKIEQALVDIRTKKLQAQKGKLQARMGMAWKLGTYGKEVPRWDRANLKKPTYQIQPLKYYHDLAVKNRPEWVALQKEVEAREAMWKSEKAQSMPSLFLGARAEYASAPHRKNQPSSFAHDPLNTLNGGVVLGLKWDLPFWERSAKNAQTYAEFLKAQAKHRHLSNGILAEVEREYLDFVEAQEKHELLASHSSAKKKEARDTVGSFALGTATGKELLEKTAAFALSEKDRLQSLYELNLAVIQMEAATASRLTKGDPGS